MNPGPRRYRKASCRIAIPLGIPEELHGQVREVVSVLSEAPRKGHAKALLQRVCDEADRQWFVLMLHAKPFADGLTEDQLIAFYSHFDFEVAGRNPTIMVRAPQKPRSIH